jgi:hypothetical protein
MPTNEIISLSSFGSGVGKSYIAGIFIMHGYQHFSWASYLRFLVARTSFASVCPPHYLRSVVHIEPDKEWEKEYGFDNALIEYSKLGENREEIFQRNCNFLELMEGSPLIISDTRFQKEAIFLKDKLNAFMILVDGKPERGVREYDLLLTDFDFDLVLDNTAKNDGIFDAVKNIINSL